MGLKPRNRVSAMDILQVDVEYCTISYYAEGSRNDLGEPDRTLTQRTTNVKCAIDPLTRMPTYIGHSGLRKMLQQGIVEQAAFIITLSADDTIDPGDVVTDYAGAMYNVLYVVNWYTHQEASLRRMN